MAVGRGLRAMRVGVLGSGQVGQALARGFADRGHDVMIGSRDPRKPEVEGRGHTDSGGERTQRAAPDAKAFNILGNAHFVQPRFGDERPTMMIAGNTRTPRRR